MITKTDNLTVPRRIGPFTAYNVSAVRGGDAYLFVADDISFLYDSGFGFCSGILYRNIRAILGDRGLDYILLSHSHYDHALGSALLTVKYPQVKIVAFEYAARILRKESARAVMRRLDLASAKLHSCTDYEDYTSLLRVDIEVHDGDSIELGKYKIDIISLPGHTRDSIAFLIDCDVECDVNNEINGVLEKPHLNPAARAPRIMLGTETLGMYVSEDLVMPSFLVGYSMTVESIKRAALLKPSHYLIPHWGFLEGDDVTRFFEDSLRCHRLGRDIIIDGFRAGLSHEEIYSRLEEKFYTDYVKEVYPPHAFAENTNIQIPMLLAEEGYQPSISMMTNSEEQPVRNQRAQSPMPEDTIKSVSSRRKCP